MARKSRKIKQEEQPRIYKVGIYARLSRERNVNCVDLKSGQSTIYEAIETQIQIVKEYLTNRPFFELVDVYADNGYSGTNFNRPEFTRLMEELRSGKIDCVICKDLSRFGRNHIAVGDMLNNIFPFLGVRFIAISDMYDNINVAPEEYFLTSFKNFAHAFFAQETSRKVCEAKRELREKGLFIGSKPPYGYECDPLDKHKLIIDTVVSPFVEEIFTQFANGEGATVIARDFTQRGILAPAAYAQQKHGKNQIALETEKWTMRKLVVLLKNERYIGTLIQHTTETAFYKNTPMHLIPKEEQVRIENGMPAIISKEIWDKVQAVFEKKSEKYLSSDKFTHTPNIFKGLIKCGVCGASVQRDCTSKRRKNDVIFQRYSFRCVNCGEEKISLKLLEQTIFDKFKIEPTELTVEFLNSIFRQIIIFDKKNIEFIF